MDPEIVLLVGVRAVEGQKYRYGKRHAFRDLSRPCPLARRGLGLPRDDWLRLRTSEMRPEGTLAIALCPAGLRIPIRASRMQPQLRR